MGDEGFDFGGAKRREAKRFEPPPWEKDAFEELERKRAEEAQAAEALRAKELADRTAAEEAGPATTERAAAPADASSAIEPEAGKSERQASHPAEAGGEAAGELDDKQVAEMLAGLAAEEAPVASKAWMVAIASSIVIGAIGGMLIIWAMAALVSSPDSGATGMIAGMVLLVFGAGFVFGALWLAVRTLRQRGVL